MVPRKFMAVMIMRTNFSVSSKVVERTLYIGKFQNLHDKNDCMSKTNTCAETSTIFA
jgi:hypothetical protein